MKYKGAVVLMLVILLVSCVKKEKEDTKQVVVSVKDWSSPEKIDPLDPKVNEYLDVNIRDYMIKADKAYWDKDYKSAAQYYLFLLSHNVYDIVATYNLACTYGLMGNSEMASKFLYKAIDLGFVDYNYLQKDTDFEKVRGTKVFDAAIDSIGQIIKNLGDNIIFESKTLLKCRIAKPLAFFPDREYTAVIGLHAHSSNQNEMVKIWKHFDIPEFIYVVPQAPYSVPFGLADEFRWNIDEVDNPTTLKSEKLSEEYIVDLISHLKHQYKIKDIYLLGLHQGNSVAFDIAFNNPGLIKGVVAFGTEYDIAKLSDKTFDEAKGLRFFIVNSIKDTYIDQEKPLKIKSKLEEKGFDIVYKEIDSQYSITKEALKQSEKWFLGKNK